MGAFRAPPGTLHAMGAPCALSASGAAFQQTAFLPFCGKKVVCLPPASPERHHLNDFSRIAYIYSQIAIISIRRFKKS